MKTSPFVGSIRLRGLILFSQAVRFDSEPFRNIGKRVFLCTIEN